MILIFVIFIAFIILLNRFSILCEVRTYNALGLIYIMTVSICYHNNVINYIMIRLCIILHYNFNQICKDIMQFIIIYIIIMNNTLSFIKDWNIITIYLNFFMININKILNFGKYNQITCTYNVITWRINTKSATYT